MGKYDGPPDECITCDDGGNSINGRWCKKLETYVEYLKNKKCNENQRHGTSNQAIGDQDA